eukprot:GHRQ01021377.1.p1 GENE.GHRQ01021377.1~~GHRQ01021377.1.p1  ORF type:complete len:118 (-),score=16.10 GHRQ01021377.1:514-867(-)
MAACKRATHHHAWHSQQESSRCNRPQHADMSSSSSSALMYVGTVQKLQQCCRATAYGQGNSLNARNRSSPRLLCRSSIFSYSTPHHQQLGFTECGMCTHSSHCTALVSAGTAVKPYV